MTPMLTIARASRRSRLSESCKGVVAFLSFCACSSMTSVATPAASCSFISMCLSPIRPNAWVNHRIKDIGDEVSCYDGNGKQDGCRLNHGIIAVANRRDGGISNTGDIEDIFNEERSGDQQ